MTLVAAVRSLITYLVVVVYVVLAVPIGVALGLLRWERGMYAFGHAGVWLALTLAGIRFRVTGREHVPDDTAVVFCSNHESNIDPPVLFQALHPRLHILYKAELRKVPLVALVFDVGGFVSVERGQRDRAMASIEKGAASLRAGNSFLIFPEGTRSRTGDLLPFKKGGFIMAIEAQVPVVPVAIQGGRAAMRKGSGIVRPVRVSVKIGKPVPTAGMTAADRDKLIERVRTEVGLLLHEGPVWT